MVIWKHRLAITTWYAIALTILFFALQAFLETIIGLPFFSFLASTSTLPWRIFFTTTASLRFLFNLLVLCYIFIALLAISGRPIHSLLAVSALATALAAAEYNFFKNLNTVFTLDYLKRIPELLTLLQTGFFPTYAVTLTVMALCLFLFTAVYLWKKEKPIKPRWRMTWALVSLAGLPFMASPALLGRSLEFFDFDLIFQSREERLSRGGVIAALLTDYHYILKRWYRIPPEEYSEQTIRNMIPVEGPLPAAVSEPRRIRVIFYLMESYWDPVATFPGIISPDPLKPIKELKLNPERSFRGRSAVPVFGGATIQTEFEVLTGLSAHAFGELVFPNLHGPVESIATYYQSLNPPAQTTYITAYKITFFNRNNALRHFGIERLIEAKDMLCSDTGGSWDGRTEECLITETIRLLKTPDAPELLMLSGVQNHADYSVAVHSRPFRFAEAIPESDHQALLVHANHLHDMSEQLVRLVRFVDSSNHPTLLFAFGDHLPPKFSFLTDERPKPKDWKATPFLLHANFPLPADVKEWLARNQLPAIYELNAIVQHAAGIPLSPAAKAVLALRRDCPPQPEPSDITPECTKRHQLLTYDMVLGKRYAARDADKPEVK